MSLTLRYEEAHCAPYNTCPVHTLHDTRLTPTRIAYCHLTPTAFTWLRVKNLTDGSYSYMTGAHDRLRLLSNGRLAQTVHCRLDGGRLGTFVFTSDDRGRTWVRRGLAGAPGDSDPAHQVLTTPADAWSQPNSGVEQAPAEGGFYEAALVETSPGGGVNSGHLLMVARTGSGWLWMSRSVDYGGTWCAPYPSTVRHPLAPAILARIPTTPPRIVLLTEPHFTGTGGLLGTRFVLGLQTSDDAGATWHNYSDVEYTGPQQTYSYPSVLVESEDTSAGARGGGDEDEEGCALLHTVYRGVGLVPALPAAVSAVYQRHRVC